MKTLLLTLILLFCVHYSVLAQTHTPRYVSMSGRTNAYYEYLPEGYDSSSNVTYPLIIFITGIGEFGNGTANSLPLVLKNGLTKLIENETFPKSFSVNAQTHRFIVITPQFTKSPFPTAVDIAKVLTYVVTHYKVDTARIYLTGLSYGAGLCWAYAGANAAYAKRIAAIVPIASPVPPGGDSVIYVRSRIIAAANVAVWATHNTNDQSDTVATTHAYVNYINEAPAPVPPAKKTIFSSGGHNAWDKTYTPDFKENGLNIYEWMLQYKRTTTAPPVNSFPVANAGTDQIITLPVTSGTLIGQGTDSDGTITGYKWAKVSGPDGENIGTPTASNTLITALKQGTYIFRLTVTDNAGASDSDEVSVTVNVSAEPPVDTFKLLVAPNPASRFFSLKIESTTASPAYMLVTDVTGKKIEARTNVPLNTPFFIGSDYPAGMYHVEVVQEQKKLSARLLKIQ